MTRQPPPRVYIFHGTHHPHRERLIRRLIERAREQGADATLDIQILDASETSPSEIAQQALTFPFFASRKIVWVKQAQVLAQKAKGPALTRLLDGIPVHTALVLDIPEDLPQNHPFLEWARRHPERAYVRAAWIPKDLGTMLRWMEAVLKEDGGKATPQALLALYQQTGNDVQRAYMELQKMALYSQATGRAVTEEDVALLTLEGTPPNLFELGHALAEGRVEQALRLLHELLQRESPKNVWYLLLRHFRLLLILRELQEEGGDLYTWARTMRLPRGIVRRMAHQARMFSLDALEALYRRFVDIEAAFRRFEITQEEALERVVYLFALLREAE